MNRKYYFDVRRLKGKLRRATYTIMALAFGVISLTQIVQESSAANIPVCTPDSPVKNKASDKITNPEKSSFGPGINAKKFFSVLVDKKNTKWFLSDQGLVSFDGTKWSLHENSLKVPPENLKSMALEYSPDGTKVLFATTRGAIVASLPIVSNSETETYNTGNSRIKSDTVISVAEGRSAVRWFGTIKGISANYNKKWLKDNYQDIFPDGLFRDTPITVISTNQYGDTLYVGTEGAGVARMFTNDVDAISGASEYAKWGPIEMPSDKVYSMLIAAGGVKWFGTDSGAARHIGSNTLERWTTYSTRNGLIHNFVQAIAMDKSGKIWLGTKGGVSVYDGAGWKSYTTKDGLNSDNVLCITVDNNGVVWMGTDDGVTSFEDSKFTCYR